jgi:hypothetical protein
MSLQTLTVALALSTSGALYVFAQTPPAPAPSQKDHSAHHPEANVETPPAPPPATGSSLGQAAGMPMGMMSGNIQQMMSMMRGVMTMMGAQSGMMSADVEGRIASLKAALKITEAQTPQWNRFADALRTAGNSMNGMFQQMMQPGTAATLLVRLDRQEKMLTAHLNSVKTLREAADPLYAVLSDDQKKVADGLMVGPMGMM